MLKEIPLREAIGKVLQSYGMTSLHAQAIFVFTDGTFAAITACSSCDDAYMVDDTPIDMLRFDPDILLDQGIMTSDELQQCRNAHHARWVADNERRERKQYAYLRQKYAKETD